MGILERLAPGSESLRMPSRPSGLVLKKRKGEASFCSLKHGRQPILLSPWIKRTRPEHKAAEFEMPAKRFWRIQS